jgi:hypothetical protein
VRPRHSTRGVLRERALFAALVAVVCFAPAVTYGFVYDDHWTVENNAALSGSFAPLMRALLAGRGAAAGVPDATRPAMVASLWLDRHLFGADPAGYHLHSLLLYAACSALVALAVFGITRRIVAATVGGVFFALSPVHAEVVAGVNYREDLISTIAVVGFVTWLFAARRAPPKLEHALLAAALLGVGLLGKESAVAAVPVVLAALLVRSRPRSYSEERRVAWTAAGAVLVGWGAWRGWLRAAGRDDVPLALVHRGGTERVLRTARYLVRVTLDSLFPFRWAPDYAPEPEPSAWWVAALAAIAVTVYLLVRRPSSRALGAGVAIALVAGLPTCPLLSPINERADRFAFLAGLGGAVFWGTAGARLARHIAPRFRWAVLAVAAVPLFVVARRAAAPWESDTTLWNAAVERAPASARAWTGLSRIRRMAGDLDGADRAADRAVSLDPSFMRARVIRVYNRLARGDTERARAELDDIRKRGGARQQGMRRAAHCASLPSDEAARCAAPELARGVPTPAAASAEEPSGR